MDKNVVTLNNSCSNMLFPSSKTNNQPMNSQIETKIIKNLNG